MKRFLLPLIALFLLLSLPITLHAKEQKLSASYLKLPLSFIKNEGQKHKDILYYEQGSGHTTTFTKEGISLVLSKLEKIKEHPSSEVVSLKPVTTTPFTIESLDKQEGKVNYLIGNDPSRWKTDIPTYGAILYKNVYPGIDMKFYGTNTQLEYDIIVSPKADPLQIRLSYKGIEKLSLSPSGELEILLKEGKLLQKKPLIYQTVNGERKEVEGKFVLADATTYTFQVGDYDKNQPLVIDPVLVYSTYLGGSSWDYAQAIAVDASGYAYVAGMTQSTDFPTKNPSQGSYAGNYDAFVTKLNPSGTALVYSTYLGGSNYDYAYAIAVNTSGNAYVAGITGSTDFPTKNPSQGSYAGNYDAFVTKLNPSGTALVYSTYLGGSNYDYAYAIAVNTSGNAYVAGITGSTDFPTKNPSQGSYAGNYDAFVTKLNPSGTALVYSTYLGGNSGDQAYAIAVNTSGNAYVAGITGSTDFPTKNPYQRSIAGSHDAFITKLNPSGTALVYSTYLGGNDHDHAYAIAVDASGNAYVAGYTVSPNFPTKNPYQSSFAGNSDTFVTKLNPSGTALVYSTYLGGNDVDYAYAIAVDVSGNAYVVGQTFSPNFPTKNPYQRSIAGSCDAFITKLNPSGTALVYSTYLGGNDGDEAYAIAVDASGNAYVAGGTVSPNFPTQNALQPSLLGLSDAFIAKIGDRGDSPSFSSPYLAVTLDPFDAGLVTGPTIKCGEDSTGSWDKCQNTYRFGSRVSLSARANPGWEFKWWDDGKTCYTNNPLNLTMNGPKTLTARFSGTSGMKFVPPVHSDVAYSDCPYGGSKFSMVWTGMYGGADNRRCEGSGGHPGVDITKSSANEKIYSIGKGTVIKRVDSVSRTGFGRYVVIRHDNVNYDGCSDCPKSVYSLYAHLQSIDKNFPKENKTVESDQLIGIMGNSGTKAIHLHFQIQGASWGPTPFWPKYTDSAGKLQPYPTGQNCGPNGKEWCDLYDLNDAQRQEAARNVRNNTINPIWLIENGTYGP